jgi:hypothetical protein
MASSRPGIAATVSVTLLAATVAGAGIAPPAANADSTRPSAIWGGYVVDALTVDVEADWTVPDIDCHVDGRGVSTNMSMWIGVGGWGTETVAQTGIDARCVRGTPSYYAWWELETGDVGGVELDEARYPVRKGDRMHARVETFDGRAFTFTLRNENHGAWKFHEKHSFPAGVSVALNSGEAIVETPTFSNNGGTYLQPLTKFADFKFENFRVNGASAGGEIYDKERVRVQLVVERRKDTLILTQPDGPMDDKGSFRVTHLNRGPSRPAQP